MPPPMLLSDRPLQPVAFDARLAALYASFAAVLLLAASPLAALAVATFLLLNLSAATPAVAPPATAMTPAEAKGAAAAAKLRPNP